MGKQKEDLKNYQKNLKEYNALAKRYSKLLERLSNVEVVSGKVKMSSHCFPYTETHLTVQMQSPSECDTIKWQISRCEERMLVLERAMMSAKEYVDTMEEGIEKTIVTLVLIDGERQTNVANLLNYSQARVSQVIKHVLQDL